jgi:hypothetical protein
MNPSRRNAKTVVLLVAFGFLIVGILNLLLEWLKCRHDHTQLGILRCIYLAIPILIGVIILARSRAIVDRLEDYLDED